MTTGMAIPRVKLQNTNPLSLDERLIYGNIPRWIAEGVDIREIRIPQASYAKQLGTLPPLYSGYSNGILRYGTAARQPAHVRPMPLRSPREGCDTEGLTAYVTRSHMPAHFPDNPYVYSSPELGQQPNRRSWRSNFYNTHAKEGFKFWLEEKKPVSSSQKYTFGTYKTNLGLGNAPRN